MRTSVSNARMDTRDGAVTERETASLGVAASTRLDFAHADFDPALALRPDSGAVPPYPRMRALDTVRQCRRLLPGAEATTSTRGQGSRDLASFAAQALAKQRAERFVKQEEEFAKREKLCDALANSKHAREGPLRVLRDARERRERVKVVTRHGRGVRGVATAYVVAFDKFANMILTDVDETYTVRIMREVEQSPPDDANGLDVKPRTRRAPKLEERSRHMQQIFVRGEQIVSVSIPQPVGR